MSYCRWSSDGFKSDVYCYEDVSGGFTVHMAGAYVTNPEDIQEYTMEKHKEDVENGGRDNLDAHLNSIKKRVYADHPDDGIAGQSFNFPTQKECAEFLEFVRSKGYYVPQYALNELYEEIGENDD